jgi:myo-inositol-1(or 4)-monophosphatase
MAAGIVIVREAGGIVTGLDGSDNMLESGSIIAANIQMQKVLLPFVLDAPAKR